MAVFAVCCVWKSDGCVCCFLCLLCICNVHLICLCNVHLLCLCNIHLLFAVCVWKSKWWRLYIHCLLCVGPWISVYHLLIACLLAALNTTYTQRFAYMLIYALINNDVHTQQFAALNTVYILHLTQDQHRHFTYTTLIPYTQFIYCTHS